MDNFNPFPEALKKCPKLLPNLVYIYSVVETNYINPSFNQVQVNVGGVFKNHKSRHSS